MAVPPVDPSKTSPSMRAAIRFARSAPGRWFAVSVSSRLDPLLLRATAGRLSTFAMAPVVNLTALGRRTGEPRSCALLYFTQGDDVILVASSFGRERHPAWYHNVRAHPDVTLTAGGRGGPYRAREAEGAERERLFALATRLYPGYADYVERAGRAGRTIPVLVLSPR